MKARLSINLLLLCTCLLSSISLLAQIEKQKEFNQSFDITSNGSIDVQQSQGPLIVKASLDGQIKIEATVRITGKNEEDVQKALNKISVQANKNGDKVSVKGIDQIKSWSTNNRETRITFKDGTTIRNLKDIEVSMTVYVPKLAHITLKNKYDVIQFGNLDSDVDMIIYDGRVEGGSIAGDLNLNAKYSKGEIGQVAGDCKLVLYDSKMSAGSAKKVTGDLKYTDWKMQDIQSIDISIYESDVVLQNVQSNSVIKDKYSTIELLDAQNLDLELYESTFKANHIQDLILDSKYGQIDLQSARQVNATLYEDHLNIATLDQLKSNSKYTHFKSTKINNGLHLESYEDTYTIASLSPSFDKVFLNGKYTKLNVNLATSTQYSFSCDLKYGSLSFPKARATFSERVEKNDKIVAKAIIGNNPTSNIDLICYECKINIEEQ